MSKAIFWLLLLLASIFPTYTISAEFKQGGVYQCAKIPGFIRSLGMSQSVAIDTTVIEIPGVVLRELDAQKRLYQHPSWRIAGHVGSTVRDQFGNIYVVSVPSIGLDTNPLEHRNKVYRISAKTGLMSEFISILLPDKTDQTNPFGNVGLAIDCETNSLYVSSVAGSTPQNSAGSIYRINLASRKVVDQISGVDALGLGVFNFTNQKRLYYGDARSSSLFSVPLTQDGYFNKAEKPRYEISLLSIKNGDSTQVKKIVFAQRSNQPHTMSLSDVEFTFRMQAETGRQFRHYDFILNDENQRWEFVRIRR